MRSQILDYLFKPGYGAALQQLKVEIGGDANSSNGSEASHMHSRDEQNYERGYEWWLMREAKRRNPSITFSALEWSVPGWVGDGNYFSQDNLDYIVNFLKGAKRQGLTIDYVGTINEPLIIHQKVDWEWVKRLNKSITSHGLNAKLVVGDDPRRGCCPSYLPWDDVNAMVKDPDLAKAVDVIGSHYAGGVVPAEAYRFNKPVWSTEDGPWTDEWNQFRGGSYAPYGSMFNLNYLDGKMTSTNIWNLVTAYYDNQIFPNSGLMRANEPWSGHFEVMSPIWITAHTTQFAKPGWRYLDSASKRLPNGGSAVTLASSTQHSTIFETQQAKQPQTVRITGIQHRQRVHVWRSTATEWFTKQPDLPVVNGTYEITLEPDAVYTVTTTTGQRKGDATAPPTSPFPPSYKDTFETGQRGQQPKYLAQQAGSFELTPCKGKPGQCVEQVVDEQPVEWFHAYPTSYLGDPQGWANATVETKVRHDVEGSAQVWGRIGNNGRDSEGISMPARPDGYYLSVEKTGRWYLRKSVDGQPRQLAAGFTELPANQWHTIAIGMRGTTITAHIDGHQVGSATDATYSTGRVGIGTEWNRTQFDDFKVVP